MSPDDHAYPPVGRAKLHESGTTTVPPGGRHDRPGPCAVEVGRRGDTRIGRIRG